NTRSLPILCGLTGNGVPQSQPLVLVLIMKGPDGSDPAVWRNRRPGNVLGNRHPEPFASRSYVKEVENRSPTQGHQGLIATERQAKRFPLLFAQDSACPSSHVPCRNVAVLEGDDQALAVRTKNGTGVPAFGHGQLMPQHGSLDVPEIEEVVGAE